MKQAIRLLVAERGELMCAGIGAMLKDQADMVLLGEAKTKEEIVCMCQHKPDLLLLAQNIPCASVPSLIGELKECYPSIKILILTSCQDITFVQATVKAGADGYALSDKPMTTVLSAIRAVAGGEGWLNPGLGIKSLVKDVKDKELPQLTEQKLMILRQMASGASNQEIATRLQISKRTVNYHLRDIYDALEVDSRAEATHVAHQMNLL